MATIRTVTTECDMPHLNDKSPAQTFTLHSASVGQYTVDLCEVCASKVMAPVMANGQRVVKRRVRNNR